MKKTGLFLLFLIFFFSTSAMAAETIEVVVIPSELVSLCEEKLDDHKLIHISGQGLKAPAVDEVQSRGASKIKLWDEGKMNTDINISTGHGNKLANSISAVLVK